MIDERAIRGIHAYTLLYVVLFFAGTLFVLEDAVRTGSGLGSFEAMSATAATSGNVEPGFGTVGTMATYDTFADSTKVVMVVLMWVGRLEILPVIAAFWRR